MIMEKISKNKYDWQLLLSQEEIESLNVGSSLLSFGKGETIIKQGFMATHILLLEEGMAKLNVESGGRNTTIKIVTAGDFIGLMCSFVNKNVDFSAVTIIPSKVRLIDRSVFEKLIGSNGNFAVSLVKMISELTNSTVHDLINLSHKNVNGAIATLLLDLRRIFGSDSFDIPFTRSEMADALGYSKESIINTLSEYKKEGLISVEGKKLELLDLVKLDSIAKRG